MRPGPGSPPPRVPRELGFPTSTERRSAPGASGSPGCRAASGLAPPRPRRPAGDPAHPTPRRARRPPDLGGPAAEPQRRARPSSGQRLRPARTAGRTAVPLRATWAADMGSRSFPTAPPSSGLPAAAASGPGAARRLRRGSAPAGPASPSAASRPTTRSPPLSPPLRFSPAAGRPTCPPGRWRPGPVPQDLTIVIVGGGEDGGGTGEEKGDAKAIPTCVLKSFIWQLQ